MASFPSTVPPDVTEINEYIRFWLGNIGTDIISDSDLNDIIYRNISKYEEDELCKITYFSTVDTLRFLIREQAADDGSSGSSGSVNRRKEKRGKTEIEVEYSDESDTSTGWDKILEDLLKLPSSIGCDPFSDDDEDAIRAPIIGGADINGYEEGFRTRDKFGRAIKENRYGYGRSRFGRRLF